MSDLVVVWLLMFLKNLTGWLLYQWSLMSLIDLLCYGDEVGIWRVNLAFGMKWCLGLLVKSLILIVFLRLWVFSRWFT